MPQYSEPVDLPMNSPRPRNPVVLVLWVNAVLLAAIFVVMLSRGGPALVSPAMGQFQPPIAGGAGVFVMPGQMAINKWGCYLLDVDRQTLVAYEYSPVERHLQFMAARSYKYDREMHDVSTSPPTEEIRRLWEKELQIRRQAEQGGAPAAKQADHPQPPRDPNQ